jgi:hypothetical protein
MIPQLGQPNRSAERRRLALTLLHSRLFRPACYRALPGVYTIILGLQDTDARSVASPIPCRRAYQTTGFGRIINSTGLIASPPPLPAS